MLEKFEKTFVLSIPRDRAWQVFTDPRELSAWGGAYLTREFDAREGGRIVLEPAPGFTVEGEVLEAEPGRLIRYTEGAGVLPAATEVTVSFEDTGTGTRVTVVQAGFGDGEEWETALDGYSLGWDQAIADLQLYLRTGVSFRRMFTWRVNVGTLITDAPAGPEVVRVLPGTCAEHAGLRAGDILVQLGAAPVYDRSDVWVFTREHEPGEEVELTYVRGGEILRGRGVLTPFGQ